MLADVCGEDTSVGLCVPASTDVPVVLDKVSPRYSKQKFTYMLVFWNIFLPLPYLIFWYIFLTAQLLFGQSIFRQKLGRNYNM